MNANALARLPKWPFLAAAAVLLAAAGHIAGRSDAPFATVQLLVWMGAVVLAGIAGVAPYWLEYRALERAVTSDLLTTAVGQLQNLEGVARHVTAATAQWHNIQEQAAATQKAVKEIAERTGAEARGFAESLQRANDTEKQTLRLEVEKSRRIEGDWLQVVVGLLDHVFALHQAAVNSGRADVAQQLDNFQNACRDIARRVGVTQIEARPGEPFDSNIHRLPEADAEAPDDAYVETVLAPGVGFQGRLLRPAIVLVKTTTPAVTEEPSAQSAEPEPPPGPATGESAT